MKNFTALVFLTLSTSTFSLRPEIKAIVDEMPAGLNWKNYTINSAIQYIISITNLTNDMSRFPPHACVECFNCDKLNPAIIVFKQERGITSFQLPVIMRPNGHEEMVFNQTERTLCPYESYSFENNQKCEENVTFSKYYNKSLDNSLIVLLSTSNKKNVTISLNVNVISDFVVELDVNKTTALTLTSSVFYLYEFSNDADELSVVAKVESNSSACMIMSVQNKSCPLIETGLIFQNGYFQTVTYVGAITVSRSKFPAGFYVVFSLVADDSYCSSQILQDGIRFKTAVFSISKTLSTEYYLHVVLCTILVILIFYAVMIILVWFCFMRKDVIVPNLELYSATESCEPSTSTAIQQPMGAKVIYSWKSSGLNPDDTLSIKTDSSLDEIDIDVLSDAELDKDIFRTKLTLCLSDLAKKNPTVLKKKSQLYFWNLATVAIFYSLPACQLILKYENILLQSGNQDLCYYNFLCSHPLGYLYDFNHVFSNIGYITLGILFFIITYRKKSIHNVLLTQNKILDRHFGVPQHFGIFYAMGTSLIIEGILSACYHVCPNRNNFQFDVCFMYIISTLCMIKIYQSRHPDVNATAYSTFFLIALILFLNIFGIFTKSYLFWAVVTVIHVGTLFYLSLQIYYVGRFKFDGRAAIRYMKEFRYHVCSGDFWRPVYPTRFCLLAVINICNWSLDIVAFVMNVRDFSSYVLLIFILNLILYTTFYIIMKIVSKEKILLQPLIYIVLAVLCWSGGMFYFLQKTISWKITPAESRMYNRPCSLVDFYDNHDIWHFLSSAGLFFSFLVLLTLDDDLIFVHRCSIPVF